MFLVIDLAYPIELLLTNVLTIWNQQSFSEA